MTDTPIAVRIRTGDCLPDRAMVRVVLLDVTLADAPSEQVTIQVVRPVRGRVDRVDLPAPPASPGRRYEVRVHVDVDDSGEVSHGDWISTQAHPVSASGGEVEVPLTRV